MDDVLPGEVNVANKYLLHKFNSLTLIEPFFDYLIEIRIAKLSNDICVVLGSVYLMKREDMRQHFQLFQNLDLALEQNFIDLIFEHAEINDFDSNGLTGLIRPAFIDMAGITFTYDIIKSIGITLYFFPCKCGAHVLCFSNLKNNNI